MREDATQRDWRNSGVRRFGQFPALEISGDVAVQINHTGIREAQRDRSRTNLAQRADREHRVGVDLLAASSAANAIGARPGDLAVADQCNTYAGYAIIHHPFLNVPAHGLFSRVLDRRPQSGLECANAWIVLGISR